MTLTEFASDPDGLANQTSPATTVPVSSVKATIGGGGAKQMWSNAVSKLTLVVDDNTSRLVELKRTIQAIAFDTDVFTVDASEGQTAIHLIKDVIARPGGRPQAVMLVRSDPRSWATAAILTAVRGYDHTAVEADRVVIAEGTLDTLPVAITDFPSLRILSPENHPCEVVTGFVDAKVRQLSAGSGTTTQRMGGEEWTRTSHCCS